MIEKNTIETFEDVINESSFIKNIKRMFIMKQTETYKIKKINIEYGENIKSFKINIEKDTTRYFIDYKIKMRTKKSKVNGKNCKKRKLNIYNNSIENKEADKKNDIHAENFDSSKPDFNNIKIGSPNQNISTNNGVKHENNSTIK